METKLEAAPPLAAPLVTGHFQEGPSYATWRSRGTADWLLVATLGGRGRFGSDGGEIAAMPGTLTLLRPGTRHDYGTESGAGGWELLWAHFRPRPDWLPYLTWPEATPGLMTLTPTDPAAGEKITARLFEMHRLATGALRRRDQFALNALEEALLWADTQNPRSGAVRLDPRVQAAMDFLCSSLAAPVSSATLAAACGLSESRLSHLFRAQTGETLQQFLERQRLGRACQLLDFTAYPVAAIAVEVGFENPFYFTLRFKRFAGCSPREYRKRVPQSHQIP